MSRLSYLFETLSVLSIYMSICMSIYLDCLIICTYTVFHFCSVKERTSSFQRHVDTVAVGTISAPVMQTLLGEAAVRPPGISVITFGIHLHCVAVVQLSMHHGNFKGLPQRHIVALLCIFLPVTNNKEVA